MSSDYDRLFPRVGKVLLSKAAASIDFWCNGMHVYGGGYYFVSYAPTQGWIGLKFAKSGKGAEATQVTAGAEAQYVHEIRVLWFPSASYGMRSAERAGILHECTHALRHIMLSGVYEKDGLCGSSIRGQLKADDEAAAHIAGSLFYLYENGAEWPTRVWTHSVTQ